MGSAVTHTGGGGHPAAAAQASGRTPVLGRIVRAAILGHAKPFPPFLKLLFDQSGWFSARCLSSATDELTEGLHRYDVAIVLDRSPTRPSAPGLDNDEISRLVDLLKRARIGAVVLTDRSWLFVDSVARIVCLPFDVPADVAQGAMLAMAQLRPAFQQIESDLMSMQRIGQRLHRHFQAVDQELALAARLQREFLPHDLPEIGPLGFQTIFRPSNFVSGDTFDVLRLDETHVGFYLADAMGHGVAAGLLTMYIKNAIRPKRIYRNSYELVSPGTVVANLNDHLVSQALLDSQFVTGWYGLINIETLELKYASAGHPHPLLIDEGGSIRELPGGGCLLGIFPDQTYDDQALQLHPGQRILLYSDGLEAALISERYPAPQQPAFQPGIIETLTKRPDRLMDDLVRRLDAAPGSLAHADDVSALLIEIHSS